MQILYHTAPGLTIPQKFFIERSIELLYRSTIDSYRVRVKNPKTILRELRDAIKAYERGQIKHFIAIATSEKGKYTLKDEAIELANLKPNYLKYQTFSNEYFISVLKSLDDRSYKRTKDCLGILLKENGDYLNEVLTGLSHLLYNNPDDEEQLWKLLNEIDTTLCILYSELLEIGF